LSEPPIRYFIATPHAAASIARRGLSLELVQQVLAAPEQRLNLRVGRIVCQSRLQLAEPSNLYLVRVIVDIDRRPAMVVTAYRTSRIARYWRLGS
jgi:hypothetical protein